VYVVVLPLMSVADSVVPNRRSVVEVELSPKLSAVLVM